MLSIYIKFHLSPLRIGASIQPLVIYNLAWVVEGLAYLVAVFDIRKDEVQTSERLLVSLGLLFAETDCDIPNSLFLDQFAEGPQ
jgi:hypothetical protein